MQLRVHLIVHHLLLLIVNKECSCDNKIMSDFYDSLEDECDHINSKSSSSDKPEAAHCVDGILQSQSPKKYSFFLRENLAENGKNFQFNKKLLNNQPKKHFLPKIENNSDKGVELARNTALENQILSKQGLQLNKDGSITKSPRCETEELPFITREYRNLQFQKKKTYTNNKKIHPVSYEKKAVVKDMDEPTRGTSLKQPNSDKWKEDSHEKITSKYSAFPNSSQSKTDKQFVSNYNMTDSMKEKLLQSQKENLQKAFTTIKNFEKTKCEMTLSEVPGVSRQNNFSHQKAGDQAKSFRFAHRLQKHPSCLDSSQKQFKTSKLKIHGYLSDISLTTLRPKLNYSERHKLEKGFNIFHLKRFNKKVESDSNRSNFGDSAVEDLPEVSNAPVSCDNSAREDEEAFYQKLIERDKLLKEQNQNSARSEGPVHVGKFRSINESHSCKNEIKLIEERKRFLKPRDIVKSMDIDLPTEVDNLVNSFNKCPHYCYPKSSTNTSKVELALKGKTYGYLANARNIFRLKAQSEKRLNGAAREENLKVIENVSSPSNKVSNLSSGGSKPSKRNSPSIGIFPNIKGGFPRYLEKSPRGSKSFSKTKVPEVPWKI